jgi:MFS family permease
VRVRQSPSLPDGRGASHRGETPRYRDVFAVAEFRALWAAQVLSVGGDQLARVALTVLVYAHTGSALLAAVAYAASIAPQFLGGLLLSGLADRWPRRSVMIVCDLARVPLAALMAVPGMPTAALIGLLCAVTALGAPFGSARAAIVPDVLGDAFPLGTAITMTTYQAAQVAGFVAGGAVVGFFGARAAICIDAGTFLASAAIVAFGVRHRPAPAAHRSAPAADRSAPAADRSAPAANRGAVKNGEGLLATARFLLGQRAVRVPLLLGLLSAAYNVPEAIAVPLARAAGGGPVAASAVMAAPALGAALGVMALTMLIGPDLRQRMTAPLAFGACAILTAAALRPGLAGILVILLASGLCDSYQVGANAAFVAAVPDERRGQAFGLAIAGMQLGQGAAMVLAGAVASQAGPWLAVTVAGAVGAAASLLIVFN